VKKRARLIGFEDDEEEDEHDEEGHCSDVEVDGVDFAPMFTGLLNASGEPILRHPIVMRMGFQPKDKQYHCPTLDEGEFPGSVRVAGWVYDV
jgi:hypothetical protein